MINQLKFSRLKKDFQNIYLSFLSLNLIVIIGIIGYMQIENFTFSEAFFMTVITMSTVGFEEVHPLSNTGMIFTVFLIMFSFGLFAYFITSITQSFINGEFRRYLKRMRENKMLDEFKNHVIVCGFGRNGKQAVVDLLEHDELVVIIEKEPGLLEHELNLEIYNHKRLVYINGDSTLDEVLMRAKAPTAKALITTLPNDALNLYVVLAAREYNKKMVIISRASDDHSISKLKRGGADNVIMPDKVGGTRMAKLVSQPDIVEFIESILIKSEGEEVNLVEVSCEKMASCIFEHSIGELKLRSKTGANLIGIKNADGSYQYNPSPETRLNKHIKLFVLGTPMQIKKLKETLFTTQIKGKI